MNILWFNNLQCCEFKQLFFAAYNILFMKHLPCNVMCNVFILKLIALCLYIGGFSIGFWSPEVASLAFVLPDLLYMYTP